MTAWAVFSASPVRAWEYWPNVSIEQMKRAHTFGLDVRFDEHTFTFFIADAATNTVVAPPPMNIPTVEAWLDDYEKSSQKNDIAR